MWWGQERITEVHRALAAAGLPCGPRVADPKPLTYYEFKHDLKDYKVYWDVRKGLIPIVGGARETGKRNYGDSFHYLECRVPPRLSLSFVGCAGGQVCTPLGKSVTKSIKAP